MLDLMGVPYTHSGVTTSAIAIDKELTKLLLVPAGVRMPKGTMVRSESLFGADPLPRPYVLKPVNEAARSVSPSSRTRATTATRSAAKRGVPGTTSTSFSPNLSSAAAS
jgi:D-alanine-D-alanine ligase-like ATP-grasp enzyme